MPSGHIGCTAIVASSPSPIYCNFFYTHSLLTRFHLPIPCRLVLVSSSLPQPNMRQFWGPHKTDSIRHPHYCLQHHTFSISISEPSCPWLHPRTPLHWDSSAHIRLCAGP